MLPSRPIEERFWENVDKKGPLHPYRSELGHCWIWMRCRNRDGYGQISESAPDRKTLKAHRVSYEIHNGSIPISLKVRHNCDNPPCVNPAHLLCGTDQDNSDDKVKRERQLKREKHGKAKLTEGQVAEIRCNYVRGSHTHGQIALAQKYEVGQTAIGKIVNGENWK